MIRHVEHVVRHKPAPDPPCDLLRALIQAGKEFLTKSGVHTGGGFVLSTVHPGSELEVGAVDVHHP